MKEDKYFPKLDIPVDFMAVENIDREKLGLYAKFPCRIRSAIFFLCTRGEIRSTVNISEYTLRQGDFVFLVPDSFIQLHSFSEDMQFSAVAFSSTFMNRMNMVRTAFEFIPLQTKDLVIHLGDNGFSLCRDFFSLLVRGCRERTLSMNDEIKLSVMNIILSHLREVYSSIAVKTENRAGRDQQIYAEFIRLLHHYYETEHKVGFYAAKIGITVQHFCNTVHRVRQHR